EFLFDGSRDLLNIGTAAQRKVLEIDEEQVLLSVIGKALLERDRQEILAQFHWAFAEDAGIHKERIAPDDRLEIHQRQNVALDVDAGRNLDQLEPVGAQRKDAALGDVKHPLPARGGKGAAEGDVLDRLNKLARPRLFHDRELAVFNREP